MAFQTLKARDWLDEIDYGLKYRREYGVEASWSELEAMFYNRHRTAAIAGPNIVMTTGDAFLSAMCTPNPKILVKPLRADSIMGARMTEQVYNQLLKQCKIRHAVDRALLHTYCWGSSFLKIGYDSEFGYDPQYDLGGTKNPQGLTFTSFDKHLNRIEFNENIQPGMPWVQAVCPHDIVLPYGVVDLADAPWYAHRVIRHIDLLRSDPKFENTRNLEPTLSRRDFVNSYRAIMQLHRWGVEMDRNVSFVQGVRQSMSQGDTGSNFVEYCEMWEVHDRRTGRVMCVVDDYEEFIRNEQDMLQIKGLPLVHLSMLPRTRTIWTTPDAHYVREHQKELSDIAIQRMKQRRVSVLKFLFDKNVISKENMDRAMSAEVGFAIPVDTTKINNGELNSAIAVLNPQGVNNTLYQEELNVRNSAYEVSAISANGFGQYDQKTHRSATETNAVSLGSQVRLTRRGALLKDCYSNLFEKIGPIIMKYWTQPRVIEAVGPDGQPQWASVTGEDLRGQYMLEVGMSSEPEETQETREQLAAQMYMQFSQDPYVDQVGLRRWIAGEFNDVSFSSIFKQGVLGGGNGPGGASGASGLGGGLGGSPQIPATNVPPPEENDGTSTPGLPGPG